MFVRMRCEFFSTALLCKIVFETIPGGGAFSVVGDGVGLGSVLAVVCSWQRNKSILWAVLAGPEAGQKWQAVNDGVMGGISDGRFQITPDRTLEFFGALSLEKNGGFASVRTKPTAKDTWTEVAVPLADFIPTAFGRQVQGMGPVEPDQINGMGFMLSDRKARAIQAGSRSPEITLLFPR